MDELSDTNICNATASAEEKAIADGQGLSVSFGPTEPSFDSTATVSAASARICPSAPFLALAPWSDRIQNALAYAMSNLKNPLSLTEAARLSSRQFSRAFRDEAGERPRQGDGAPSTF